jgi:hypothetical protein
MLQRWLLFQTYRSWRKFLTPAEHDEIDTKPDNQSQGYEKNKKGNGTAGNKFFGKMGILHKKQIKK